MADHPDPDLSNNTTADGDEPCRQPRLVHTESANRRRRPAIVARPRDVDQQRAARRGSRHAHQQQSADCECPVPICRAWRLLRQRHLARVLRHDTAGECHDDGRDQRDLRSRDQGCSAHHCRGWNQRHLTAERRRRFLACYRPKTSTSAAKACRITTAIRETTAAPIDRRTSISRSTTDVGGGADIGWISAGEWLAYTVNVARTDTLHDGRARCGVRRGRHVPR